MARLLISTLKSMGHKVEVVSEFRSHDRSKNGSQQENIRQAAEVEAAFCEKKLQTLSQERKPELWFTYHVYYRAPDWLGPRISQLLGIPYVIAEASLSSKRALAPWTLGHQAAENAVSVADAIICLTQHDLHFLQDHSGRVNHIHYLPPFINATPFINARRQRNCIRKALNERWGCSLTAPWLLSVGMLRYGDKLASYQMLATALGKILDVEWNYFIVGDGEARKDVEGAFSDLPDRRIIFLGELPYDELAAIYAACDLYVWPAVNEAYGLSFLEAQAAGLPIVSTRTRGVPDVVLEHETGLLSPEGDTEAFAELIKQMLKDKKRRQLMGRQSTHFVSKMRGTQKAAQGLRQILSTVSIVSRKT